MTGTATRPVLVGVDASPAALTRGPLGREPKRSAAGDACAVPRLRLRRRPAAARPVRGVRLLLEHIYRWLRRAADVAREQAPGVGSSTWSASDWRRSADRRLGGGARCWCSVPTASGGLRGALIGSVALRVTAEAHCPVVVVRGHADPGGPVVASAGSRCVRRTRAAVRGRGRRGPRRPAARRARLARRGAELRRRADRPGRTATGRSRAAAGRPVPGAASHPDGGAGAQAFARVAARGSGAQLIVVGSARSRPGRGRAARLDGQ